VTSLDGADPALYVWGESPNSYVVQLYVMAIRFVQIMRGNATAIIYAFTFLQPANLAQLLSESFSLRLYRRLDKHTSGLNQLCSFLQVFVKVFASCLLVLGCPQKLTGPLDRLSRGRLVIINVVVAEDLVRLRFWNFRTVGKIVNHIRLLMSHRIRIFTQCAMGWVVLCGLDVLVNTCSNRNQADATISGLLGRLSYGRSVWIGADSRWPD